MVLAYAVPGFPSVYLSQIRCGFNIRLYFASLSQLSFLLIFHKMKRVALAYLCTWLSPVRLSCLATYHKVKGAGFKEAGFNVCLYLAFPLSCLSTYRKMKQG